MRKLILYAAVILVAAMLLLPGPVYSAGNFSYESEAQILNDLGLYRGTSNTSFDPDLGAALNRETGVVMLLRIFGLEADALAMSNPDEVLARFSDASAISDWARNAVAYAVEQGLVAGYPDGTFGPGAALNGKAYCTLILRQLGYTPDYNNAPQQLAERNGLAEEQAALFSGRNLIKDDLVGISYGSLRAVNSGGRTVIESLLESGVVPPNALMTAGLTLPDLNQEQLQTGGNTPPTGDGGGQPPVMPQVTQSPPPAPQNLIAKAGDSMVELSWQAVEKAEGYILKRSTAAGGPYETIISGLKETVYTDRGVQNGTTYYYVVSALSGAEDGTAAMNSLRAETESANKDLEAASGIRLRYLSGGGSEGSWKYVKFMELVNALSQSVDSGKKLSEANASPADIISAANAVYSGRKSLESVLGWLN